MTPDEYCDTIRDIAFDRETTRKAFADGVAEGKRQVMAEPEMKLYARPPAPPDVRELVEALRGMMDVCGRSFATKEPVPINCPEAVAANAALAKFGGGV